MIAFNKKASSVIMILFELIVVMLVVGIVTEVTRSYAQSDTVLKTNVANDMVMMINALVGVPGDAEVEYPVNMSKFSVLLDSGSLTILEKGESSSRYIIRTFYLPQDYKAEGVVEEISRICLQKKNQVIQVKPCPEAQNG